MGKKAPSKNESTKKRQKLDMDALLTQIVSLLVRHNPRDLSFSRVSQLTGVPRSTLYYYFGNRASNMVEESVKFGMRAFVVLYSLEEDQKLPTWEEFQAKRLQRAVQTIHQFPFAPSLYFKFRNDQGKLGEMIREIEEEYVKKLARIWEKYKKKPASIHSIRLTAYLKLGILYGFSVEPELWIKQSEGAPLKTMLSEATDLITHMMSLDFNESNHSA